jgi:2-iminobutanoate/2-iminopropanoate deaminase
MEVARASLWPDLEQRRAYSQAIKVGDTIYVSGTIGIDERGELVSAVNMRLQIRQIYRNISASLAQLGATLDHVVAETVLVTDLDQAWLSEALTEPYSGRTPPARTVTEVRRLAHPDAMCEIACIART